MLRMLSARRMCLCHTVNHTIYIIERRGGFARRDGVRWKIRCGLLSVKRRCGASVWTDSSTSCAPSRTRRAAENGPWTWTPTAGTAGFRVATARATCRQRQPRPERRWRCAVPLAGLTRGPENFELVRVDQDRSRGRVGDMRDISPAAHMRCRLTRRTSKPYPRGSPS